MTPFVTPPQYHSSTEARTKILKTTDRRPSLERHGRGEEKAKGDFDNPMTTAMRHDVPTKPHDVVRGNLIYKGVANGTLMRR